MAATETFDHFNATLPPKTRESLRDLTDLTTQELLAARSEDARNRIVEGYIRESHKVLVDQK